MRKITICILALILTLSLACSAFAASDGSFVFDDADILNYSEEVQLNELAQTIEDKYGCSLYMMTVQDFTDYGSSWDVFQTTWEIYHDRNLGYGSGRDGVLLLLSMEDRDFAFFVYGDNAEYALNSYAQEQLESSFLDDFACNSWYTGFQDYLSFSGKCLDAAASGKPLRENHSSLIGISLLVSCAIAFLIALGVRSSMKSARTQTGARDYVTGSGLELSVRSDIFTHQTVTRRRISTSNSTRSGGGGGFSRSGGGGSGRSGKF